MREFRQALLFRNILHIIVIRPLDHCPARVTKRRVHMDHNLGCFTSIEFWDVLFDNGSQNMLDKKFAIPLGFLGNTVELAQSSPRKSGCKHNLTGKLWRGGFLLLSVFSAGESVMTGHLRRLKATRLHPVSG